MIGKRAAIAVLGWLACCAAPAAAQDAFTVQIDLLELHAGRGADHLALESTTTVGAGNDQFVLNVNAGSETRVDFEEAEVEALVSHGFADGATYVLAGASRVLRQGRDLHAAALGIQSNIVPWLSLEHFFYLSQHGDLTGAAEIIATWNLSPSLRIEPRLGLGWAAQDITREDVAAGPTDMAASIRLRRAIAPQANVYVGLIHEGLLGGTRRIAEAAGETVRTNRIVLGGGITF